MHSTVRRALVALILVTIALPAAASSSNVLVVRVESLDAFFADANQVLALVGADVQAEALLPLIQAGLGLPDLAWLDRSRPLALALPGSTMALGAGGFVGAYPVSDEQAALAALGTVMKPGEPGEDGVHPFDPESESPFYVRPWNGYLIAGAARSAVASFEADGALMPAGLPPGSIALELDIATLAPFIRAGMQMATQQIGSAETESDTEPEEPPAEGVLDPRARAALTGLMTGLVDDLLNNTSRVQLSLDLTTEHVLVHGRVIPVDGSTLGGWVAAQRGAGLPEIARYIEPDEDEFIVAVGHVALTEAVIDALAYYVGQYSNVIDALFDSVAEELPTNVDWIAEVAETLRSDAGGWLACFRGDMAMSLGFGEDGMQATQLFGLTDGEACGNVMGDVMRLMGGIETAEGKPLMELTENAFEHGGVTAMRQRIDFRSLGELDEAEAEAMDSVLGSEGLIGFFGVKGDVALTVMGTDAEQRFRGLAERVGSDTASGGLDAGRFAPLEPGPGLLISFDLGQLFEFAAGLEDEPGDEATPQDEAAIEALTGLRTPMVLGFGFDERAVTGKLAFPLEILRVIAETAEAEPEPEPEPPEEDERT